MEENFVSVLVPPDPRSGRMVRAEVADFAAAHGISDEDLREFMTAIGEALANAIEHSNCAAQIEVTCRLEAGGILIGEVIDAGIGFAPPSTIEPRLPDAFAERGRGLGLMQRCTDQIEVRSAPGQGTRVRLSRFLRAVPTPGD